MIAIVIEKSSVALCRRESAWPGMKDRRMYCGEVIGCVKLRGPTMNE